MIKSTLTALLAVSLILTGCQGSEQASAARSYPLGPVTMTAGANSGSGFDLTMRAVVDTLHNEQTVNVPLPLPRPDRTTTRLIPTVCFARASSRGQLTGASIEILLGRITFSFDGSFRDEFQDPLGRSRHRLFRHALTTPVCRTAEGEHGSNGDTGDNQSRASAGYLEDQPKYRRPG